MRLVATCVNGVGVCVIPQTQNNYRPLALRHKPLALVSAFLLTVKIAALLAVSLTPSTAYLSTITTSRIVQFTNAERAKAGLPALTVNSQLATAAGYKASDMLANDYFSHISPSGVTPWFWMSKAGYSYVVAGENLAIDFNEAEDVVAAWMASPSHRANILQGDYTETGVAVATGEFQGGTSTVVVHMFGKPSGTAGVPSNPAGGASGTAQPAAAGVTTPSPTPSPVATPIIPTPPPAAPAPRTPRISVVNANAVVQDSLTLHLEGEAGSTVHVLVNTQLRASVVLGDTGQAQTSVALTSLPDGVVVVRAYASNNQHGESALGPAITITKDTTGPDIANQQLAYLLHPLVDAAGIGIFAPDAPGAFTATRGGETFAATAKGWVFVPGVSDAIVVAVADEAGNRTELPLPALDAIEVQAGLDALTPSAGISLLARRMSATVLATVVVLLVLAVFVRIRIQHPALITHASLVALLAFVMLMV